MLTAVANGVIAAPNFKGKHRVLKALLRQVDGRPLRSRYGVQMVNRAQDATNGFCITGSFHRDYDDVFAEVDALDPGMAFVDVGANCGLFSMVAGKRVGPEGVVLSFEPNRRVFADLSANAVLNGLENTYLFNAAIGPEHGTMRFSGGSAEHSGVGKLSADGDVEVAVMSFDDNPLFNRLLGDRRIVVKIDVEGAEGLVVDAMHALLTRPQVEKVVVEIDDKNLRTFSSSASSVYEMMRQAGFRGRRGIGSAAHFNEIFTR